jgi:hypothetical protein
MEKRHKKRTVGWESHERAVLDRKFLFLRNILIAAALPVLILIGLTIRNLVIERRTAGERRPRVVNSRAPELTQPFVCDLSAGLHSGNLQTYVRNVESGEASNVFQTLALHVVPERKVNIPEFDEVPNGDCQTRPRVHYATKLLSSGRETMALLPEPKVAIPPLLAGEIARLYSVSCIYYSDNSGLNHGSCDTYRFRLANGNSYFICDGSPETGKFDDAPVTSCGN